jgi:hypothetical protein
VTTEPTPDAVTLPDGRKLEAGDEFTARRLGRKLRLRFHTATVFSGELLLGGWSGHSWRTVRASEVETIHRTSKLGKGASAPPPARRRGR